MTGFFAENADGTYRTSIRNISTAIRFFKANPDAEIPTGMWSHSRWTRDEFYRWFHESLNEKINRESQPTGRKHTANYQNDQRWDARQVNEYMGKRLRHIGSTGLLRTPELQARYPHINNQREAA
jgi:hypothetical protein